MYRRLPHIPIRVLGLVSTLFMVSGVASPAQSFEGLQTAQRRALSELSEHHTLKASSPDISSTQSAPASSNSADNPTAIEHSPTDLSEVLPAFVGSQPAHEPVREERSTESATLPNAIGSTEQAAAQPSPALGLASTSPSEKPATEPAIVPAPLQSSPNTANSVNAVHQQEPQAFQLRSLPTLSPLTVSFESDSTPSPSLHPLAASGNPSSESQLPEPVLETTALSSPTKPFQPQTANLPESVTFSPTQPNAAFEPQAPAGYVEISSGIYVPATFLKADTQFRQAREARYQAWATYQAQLAQQSSMVAALLPYETLYGNSISPHASVSYSGMVNQTTSSDRFPLYPLPNAVPISSNYGWRTHPITGQQRFHTGIDLATEIGTPVLASLSGVVEFSGTMDGYGYTIILRHLDGSIQTLYGHLSSLYVEVGESVKQGQVIARSGNTGYSTGPHLHFEMRQRTSAGWQAIDINQIVAFAQTRLQNARQASQTAAIAAPLPFELSPPAKPSLLSEPLTSLTSAASDSALRVALEVNVSAVTVGASTPMMVTNTNGQLLTTLPMSQAFSAVPVGADINLAGQTYSQPIFVAPANGGMIALNGHYYRGRILLGIQPNHAGITAVNWVDLEQYLYSVVPSEAYPSWGKAALQAQAIAARSYAMYYRYNPVSPDWYDLCGDTRYQAYNGAERETNTTTAAVDATRSQVLVHNNTVVQALYASTDALTASAHNGVGMSQWGAATMADQGKSYLEILGRYYPNTTLSAIQ